MLAHETYRVVSSAYWHSPFDLHGLIATIFITILFYTILFKTNTQGTSIFSVFPAILCKEWHSKSLKNEYVMCFDESLGAGDGRLWNQLFRTHFSQKQCQVVHTGQIWALIYIVDVWRERCSCIFPSYLCCADILVLIFLLFAHHLLVARTYLKERYTVNKTHTKTEHKSRMVLDVLGLIDFFIFCTLW